MRRISTYILLIALLFSCDTEKTIGPADYFLKYYGLDEGDQEAVDMVTDANGFIYLFGNNLLSGSSDLYVVKTDEFGASVWEKTFKSTDRRMTARDIELRSDGNLLLLANTLETGDLDFLMLTVNATDGSEMSRKRDGYVGFDENAYSITEISDGYIVSGSTTNVSAPATSETEGFWFRFLPDFSSYGSVWSRQYQQQDQTQPLGTKEVVVKTIEASPGVFYMFGSSNRSDFLDSSLDHNFLVFATSNVGLPIAGPFQPGFSRTNEYLTSVVKDKTSTGYLLTGISEDANLGVSEIFVVKLRGGLETVRPEDAIQQQKVVTNFGFTTNVATQVTGYSTSNSDLLILSSENREGNDNIYFSRLNNRLIANDEIGGLTFGGIGNDFGATVSEYDSDRILIFGTMVLGEVNGQRKMVLMKLSQGGKFE